ncbi:hypothetical protein JOF53_006888 [Crossiella equi]|uniref:Hydrolase n=1 Tax=Crossiella equi TaxID=130796 RepID=A0ABS5AN78_9PSEU|nr:glycoside hydrolase family 16 protein [Crossiella equi]MBP2478016.1 hypothetical protein [Crossiella equi]
MRRPLVLVLTGAAVLALSTPVTAVAAGPELFDDFGYTGHTDARLGQRGWQVRGGGGGPGVGSWDPSLVSFPVVDGQKVMRLGAVTNGTPGGTRQSQVNTGRKFHEGTYAARVRFSDTPVYGPDGDQAVQTFYTITPLRYDRDPDYGEQDFEYLPNGGWGETGPTMLLTSWETYQPDPWWADNASNQVRRSHAGWRELVLQVSGGRMRYFIDGALVADHGDRFYPETPQLINFNQWFIAVGGAAGAERRYEQHNDWVYFAKGEVVSPAEVRSRVNGFRGRGVEFVDSV